LADGRRQIVSAMDNIRFSFRDDTSGFVGAMGLGGFFTGTTSSDIGLNAELRANPRLLAAATSNNPGDNTNSQRMLGIRNQAVVLGQSTLEDFYEGVVGSLGVRTAEFKDRLENTRLLNQQLENQRQRISGVNVDEEATNMIQHQRAFQATARFIAVVGDFDRDPTASTVHRSDCV
jgi:flagellar hook-associated protein 1 FlgK